MPDRTTHIMRVSLRDAPKVYRDIEIGSSKSLYALAEAIVGAFDFSFDHAFGFYTGRSGRALHEAEPRHELFADIGEESDAESVERTTVAEAFAEKGARMTFLFDYGDEWLFDVKTLGLGEREPKAKYPRVVASKGTAPEQYPDYEDDDEC